jgi:uncharacterized protein (TIGR02453 family)
MMPIISQATFQFLTDLQANNTREWFAQHKARYEAAQAEVLAISEALIKGFADLDPEIAQLKAKDTTFRIYRDIRFSNDKTPYKTNLSIYLNRAGKKSELAGFYFHFQPSGSFMAGGSWMPAADKLAAVRQEIDYHGAEFRQIAGALAAAGLTLEGEKLKTAPKGYPADHPDLEFLKLKSFIATRYLTDAEMTSPHLVPTLLGSARPIKPLVDFLNRAFGG